MTGTPNGLAVRPNGAAQGTPGAALELRTGQTMWTKDQHAALVAMGIPREASSAELGVFLHQCQRTGLDPFTRQIYLIYRVSYENGKTVNKPTMQVGIDGYRLIRDRIARREGLRVEYEDTIWYAADGQAYDVWLWDEPPAACKVAVRVDGRRFSSTLRFGEYCQRKKDGTLNKMWTEKAAHMIEKCAEADVLRKVFPQDLSGLTLEDAAPLPEDAPEPRPRVTADQVRARAAQTVKAEVVEPEAPPEPADGPILEATWTAITERLAALEVEEGNRVRAASRIAGKAMKHATEADGRKVLDTLEGLDDGAALAALLDDIALSGDPREEGEAGE